ERVSATAEEPADAPLSGSDLSGSELGQASEGSELASATVGADLGGDRAGQLDREFARLAQRDLTPGERRLAEAVLAGRDVWASGFDPESLPVLAVALGAATPAEAAVGPLLFLSPETELLRAR